MLYSPEDCIVENSYEFAIIRRYRDIFLTKQCRNSFGGYAVAQIKKAKGLDKKMNWERDKIERKTILDFCYVINLLGTIPLKKWLSMQRGIGNMQHLYGVSKLNNARDTYFLYRPSENTNYKGIANEDETSNELRLSSIPKEEIINSVVMIYNKDGYTKHCKDYKSYQEWISNRNTQRYVDIKNHDQQIDSKNLLHCRRLLDMAMEIATEGELIVRRPNAKELLKIRRGEVSLDRIIGQAEEDLLKLDELYENSKLPDAVLGTKVNDILLLMRHY